MLREADAAITEQVDHARIRFAAEEALSTNAADAPFSLEVNAEHEPDAELARVLSELRLVKDDYEVAEMRAAIDATQRGFTEVLEELPRITAEVRGERVIEGVFATRARLDGNDVGYGSIAAAGPHATILHWTRNDGPVVPGDLVLLDAGVERDSYYTADITRTFPVNGTFSDVQRRVYEAVLEAADAAFAVVRPGAIFREVHAAAMEVIARKTAEWGFLPVSAEESLEPENQFHRRYMVHGTSHHLGLDVHDCAQARQVDVHGRRARAGHGLHDRAGPVLPARRPHGARGVPRHRRAHRGRHPRHRRRRGEPLGGHPAHGRRGRGVGARGPRHRIVIRVSGAVHPTSDLEVAQRDLVTLSRPASPGARPGGPATTPRTGRAAAS